MTREGQQRAPDIGRFAPMIELAAPDGGLLPSLADISRAELTLVNTGIGKLSLTLNNQRYGTQSPPGPISPPWKYNGLDLVRFGQKLLFGIGYPNSDKLRATVRVTDLRFSFPQDAPAQVTIDCKDMLSLLEVKPSRDKNYRREHEPQIVREILAAHREATRGSGGTARATVGIALANAGAGRRKSFRQPLRQFVHRKTMTYYKAIEALAKDLDYEVFTNTEGTHLYFELARSLQNRTASELIWGRDLLSFTPTLVVWDQYTSARPSGRQSGSRARVDAAVVGEDEVREDLAHEEGDDAVLSAIAVRRTLIDNQPASDDPNPLPVAVTNLDSERAKQKAIAALRTQARKLLTADVELVGRPELKPGMHVTLGQLNAPFDGVYYITRAVHSYGKIGYRTKLSLRRPALRNPANYPGRQQRTQPRQETSP